jgi:hypothetical protein
MFSFNKFTYVNPLIKGEIREMGAINIIGTEKSSFDSAENIESLKWCTLNLTSFHL